MSENNHEHTHDHDHGHLPVILYGLGLGLFIVAFFMPTQFLKNLMFLLALGLAGYHVIFEGFEDTYVRTKQRKRFTPNVHILMTIAAFGAMAIGDFQEGTLLILIFAGAHFLEDYAEEKSKKEITNLLNLNPTEGRLILEDGSTKLVSTQDLKIGDKLQVLIGDQIPTDGIIIEGIASVDESNITGESIPKEKSVGDILFGSTININGQIIMEVTKNPEDTIFAKILKLVTQSQANLSPTATKIRKYEPIYVNAVLLFFPFFVILGMVVLKWELNDALYRGMVYLTVTSPCALAASDVPATLSALSNLAKHGVLFKGGSYLSNLADIKVVALDKTGTLTKGKPIVTDTFYDESLSEEEIKTYKTIIKSMETQSNHPLANAITSYLDDVDIIKLDVENIIGTGIKSVIDGTEYLIGRPEQFKNKDEALITELINHGKTVIQFGTQDKILMTLALMDVANENASNVITYLTSQNIHTTMITGDAKLTGLAVGEEVGIKEVIGDVYPEDKADIVLSLKEKHGMIAMLGDGINDAPALVNADIGIAMGDGTDVAIDVADAVLMKNDLCNFAYAHRVSKKLQKIVMQNIIFAMGVVVFLLILNVMGSMNLPLGVVFHEGSTIVVILNGLRLLKNIEA